MKRSLLVAGLVLAGPVAADPVRFDDLDINVDGRLVLEEMTLAFGAQAPEVLSLLDLNGDGAVTVGEARALSGAPVTDVQQGAVVQAIAP